MKITKNGYTLLEVLVVLVIISIVSSVAMLSLGSSSNKELERFTKTLVEELTLAEEEALLQPTTLGVVFTEKHYGIYRVNSNKKWQPLNQHSLPKDLELSLFINDEKIVIDEQAASLPKLLISRNGSITPFRLLIGRKDAKARYEITATADGDVRAKRRLEDS